MTELRPVDIWPDFDADGLRDYVCAAWPQLADALDREVAASKGKLIPAGQYKYENRPLFVRWPYMNGKWHVFGPVDLIPVGKVVEVFSYSEQGNTPVEILEHVAERLVRKRNNSVVRFVMATFDNVFVEEVE